MARNINKELAELIGVPYGELFYVRIKEEEPDAPLVAMAITEVGIFQYDDCNGEAFVPCAVKINALLKGNFELGAKPYNTRIGGEYYTYDQDFDIFKSRHTEGDFWEIIMCKLGLCFRTKEEAKRERPRIYKEYTGKEWEYDD